MIASITKSKGERVVKTANDNDRPRTATRKNSRPAMIVATTLFVTIALVLQVLFSQ